MATLNSVKKQIQSLTKLIGIPLFVIIIILIGVQIKQRLTPAPPPPPEVGFGKLPQIPFPKQTIDHKINFSLNTLSGNLPNFPDRLKVYQFASSEPDFFSLDKAKTKVSQLGFTSPPKKLSEDSYQWINGDPLSHKITFNIFSFDFKYSSSFLADPKLQFLTNSLDEKTSINTAQSFMEKLSLNLNDMDSNKISTSLFVIKNYTLLPASSISSSNIVRVDFFQKDVDNLPIVYPRPSKSIINFFVGELQNQSPEVLEANFSHKTISNLSSTYPIKKADVAFEQLNQGKAYLASYSGDQNISIKNIYLAYYIQEDQEFLMPIIVFEGSNGFVGYVLAVNDEWVNK